MSVLPIPINRTKIDLVNSLESLKDVYKCLAVTQQIISQTHLADGDKAKRRGDLVTAKKFHRKALVYAGKTEKSQYLATREEKRL